MCHALDGRDDKVLEPEPVGLLVWFLIFIFCPQNRLLLCLQRRLRIKPTPPLAVHIFAYSLRSTCLLAYLPRGLLALKLSGAASSVKCHCCPGRSCLHAMCFPAPVRSAVSSNSLATALNHGTCSTMLRARFSAEKQTCLVALGYHASYDPK